MRKVLVRVYDNPDDGREYGRVFKSSDLVKVQDYVRDHLRDIILNHLVRGTASALVSGYAYALNGALRLSITPGHVVDQAGEHYDTYPVDENTIVEMPAAHVANPRIDLVVAVLAVDQDADYQVLPHRKLLTPLEIEAGVDPGDPVPFNVPTERRNTATVVVRQGVAAADPVAPAAGANEVPLYRVRVEASAVALTADKVTDVRPLARSLAQALALIDQVVPYEAMLDAATALDVINTLVKRDGSGNTRLNEARVDAGVRYMPDNSFRRSAFVREDFYNLIDTQVPATNVSAVIDVYETVKRQAVGSQADPAYVPPVASVQVAPEYDCYVDPADFVNVPLKFEVYALFTDNFGAGDIQLWNATDNAEMAVATFGWLDLTANHRSSLFSITGTGVKRLVIRARSKAGAGNNIGTIKIWRARLVINPSF